MRKQLYSNGKTAYSENELLLIIQDASDEKSFQKAFTLLYSLYDPAVRRTVRFICPGLDEFSVDDISQETWITVSHKIRERETRDTSIVYWINEIARLKTLAWRRKNNCIEVLLSEDIEEQYLVEDDRPEDRAMENETYKKVYSAISNLPWLMSEVIRRKAQGSKDKDTADALNISEGNVRVLASRGRRKLRGLYLALKDALAQFARLVKAYGKVIVSGVVATILILVFLVSPVGDGRERLVKTINWTERTSFTLKSPGVTTPGQRSVSYYPTMTSIVSSTPIIKVIPMTPDVTSTIASVLSTPKIALEPTVASLPTATSSPISSPVRLPQPVKPTFTPLPSSTVTPLPTISLTPVTPFYINYWAENTEVRTDGCTQIYWQVAGVKEVYFEDQGVVGEESEQVCPDRTREYKLTVIHKDGRIEQRSVTIEVRSPSEPEPEPTPIDDTNKIPSEPSPAPTLPEVPPTLEPTPEPLPNPTSTPKPTEVSVPPATATSTPLPTLTPTVPPATSTPTPSATATVEITVTPTSPPIPIYISLRNLHVCAKQYAKPSCPFEIVTEPSFSKGILTVTGSVIRNSGNEQLNESVIIRIADQDVITSFDYLDAPKTEELGPVTLTLGEGEYRFVVRHADESDPNTAGPGSVRVNLDVTFVPD